MRKELTRRELEELYLPPAEGFVVVEVPDMRFIMVDGEGPPEKARCEAAVKWLYTVAHPIRMEAKKRMGKSFVEPPVEGLWWAEDMADLAAGKREKIEWRMMLPAPEWATEEMFAEAVKQAEGKLGKAPASLRLDRYHEGKCVQTMHVGPAEEEMETLARMYEEFLPGEGLVAHGAYHEIYLNDPHRTAPARRKTVLRQPVCAGS